MSRLKQAFFQLFEPSTAASQKLTPSWHVAQVLLAVTPGALLWLALQAVEGRPSLEQVADRSRSGADDDQASHHSLEVLNARLERLEETVRRLGQHKSTDKGEQQNDAVSATTAVPTSQGQKQSDPQQTSAQNPCAAAGTGSDHARKPEAQKQ